MIDIQEVVTSDLVTALVKLQQRADDLKANYDAKMQPIAEWRDTVRSELLRRLAADNKISESFTGLGTITRAQRVNYTVTDVNAFQDFVLEEKDLSLFGKTLVVSEVGRYIDEHDQNLPPGVSKSTSYTLRFTAAKSK